jgi:phage protein D
MSHPIPAFKITLDERDLTETIRPRLVSLTLTEHRNDDSDECDIVIDDTDGMVALPPKGAQINVHIGWKQTGLVDKGTFTVSDVAHSGPPDVITLRARSANLIDAFKQQREHNFHDTTLGECIALIAARNGLISGISPLLRDIEVKHIDQTHESDASFLRRLGRKYDAVATVKNGRLLFIPINESTTSSGKALPLITITRAKGDQHSYQSTEADAYSGVRAFWHDERYSRRRSIIAGQTGNSKRLRTVYATELDARTAAVAEWQRIQRGLATFDMTLALGDPRVMPQSPVQVCGFKPQIDATEWLAVTVGHNISATGFNSRIQFETKTEPAEAEREVETDPDEGITGVIAKWKDVVSKKAGEELAGTSDMLKTITHIYTTRQHAKRAVKEMWGQIVEVRNIIAENSDKPSVKDEKLV